MKYEPDAGTSIDQAVKEAYSQMETVRFDFNGTEITVDGRQTVEKNILDARRALQLPDVDPPFHPETAADALARWDSGETVFTIEMGGLGPGYEQAIQMLVFEIIRDNITKPLPEPKSEESKTWGDATVTRCDDQAGGYSGAMVGAVKHLAYRALRDGWEKTLNSAPIDRYIQVSKNWPTPISK